MKRRPFIRAGAAATVAASTFSRVTGNAVHDPRPIKVALIDMGTLYEPYLMALAAIEDVQLVSFCHLHTMSRVHGQKLYAVSVNRENPKDALVPVYEDYREMLANEPSIDAVIVASHEWQRPRQVMDCLAAGKHVYVHPSLGTDLDAVRKLVRAVKQSDRVVQVGYDRRSLPHYRLVKERMIGERGLLDPIQNATIHWRQSAALSRRIIPKKKRLHVPEETLKAAGYPDMETYWNAHFHRRYTIGVLGGRPASMLDTLLYFSKHLPHTISATGKKSSVTGADVYTQFQFNLEFGEGTEHGIASFQLFDDASAWQESEIYVGEALSLCLSDQINDQNYAIEHHFGESHDWQQIATQLGLEKRDPENRAQLPTAAVRVSMATRRPKIYRLTLGQQKKPHQHHLERFFESIRQGTPPACSIDQAYRTELVLHKVLKAAETRQLVHLEPRDYEI